ncbi:MAG: hydrogenase expression/formation protein HypE [Clostridium sp.]|uniref:hydrogenase expression/formation protein HypE n=1 Tax=Clostridium sp. TaxID=1506 RepID=UPI002FC78B70
MDRVSLACGNGGEESNKLIEDIFYKYFKCDELLKGLDSAILNKIDGNIAVTTDSFVIKPIFFNGGNIGKLSVCGTLNDLAVSGAIPLYITTAFIIEEGLLINDLEKIVISISEEAKRNNVSIICGDTKVVEKGKCDGIYINTTGIGILNNKVNLGYGRIECGDKIVVSGTIGDHGMSIMCSRENLELQNNIYSDCKSLCELTNLIINSGLNVKFMRDPTRGGLATTLREIVDSSNKSMKIKEESIKVRDDVSNVCDMLGLDPLYIANEGKIICIVSNDDSNKLLELIKGKECGINASIIGEVIDDYNNELYFETLIGGTRILNRVSGDELPRIC